MHPADRLSGVELSLIRQINALATPLSVNLGIGEPNVEPDARTAGDGCTRGHDVVALLGECRRSLAPQEAVRRAAVRSEERSVRDRRDAGGPVRHLHGLRESGREVLVPNPGFLSYATLAKICGAAPVTYDLDPPEWQIDVEALRRKITPKTKLIVINSPSNPLGAVIASETLAAIAAIGPLVVSDEIYRQIWYDAEPATMLDLGVQENVIVLNGLSKSHAMTGLRLGWIVAREALMKPIVTAHQYVATCASVFSQALAEMILDDPDWNASWLAGVRAQFRAQREAALYAIRHELEAEIAPPAGAFYAFAPVPSCDTISFAKTLATDAAVLVIPGLAFGTRGQGFIRISYAASVEQITAGIERIGRFLRASGL
jgi:aspartate/methionine/tyrosine aminotransferase